MARGGHKGLLYAVSGRMLNAFGKRRKRGLYHQCTNELFKPNWGPVKLPSLMFNVKLPRWGDDTLPPKERVPPKNFYDKDALLAWPNPAAKFIGRMYSINEGRYFKPANLATDPKIRNYVYNALEPRVNQCFSGIGVDHRPPNSVGHIRELVRTLNYTSHPAIRLGPDPVHWGEFHPLKSLVTESHTWKLTRPIQEASSNPFPHVNETASLIQPLSLHDVLRVKSNHRLNRRAQPRWFSVKYRKFVRSKRLHDKMQQLKLEEATTGHTLGAT